MATSVEKGLQSLRVWQQSLQLAEMICKEILPVFPVEEKWSLSIQIRRAVQSIPANIAEGYGRYYYQETIRFSYIARGSLEEVFSHLTLAHRLGYLTDDRFTHLINEISQIRRGINAYILYLKQSRRGENEPGAVNTIREPSDSYLTDSPDEGLEDLS